MYINRLLKLILSAFLFISLTAAIWLYIAQQNRMLITDYIDLLATKHNIKINYSKLNVTGYPFSFDIKISDLSLRFETTNVANNKINFHMQLLNDIIIEQNLFSKDITIHAPKSQNYNIKSANNQAKFSIVNQDIVEEFMIILNKINLNFSFREIPILKLIKNKEFYVENLEIDNLKILLQNLKIIDENAKQTIFSSKYFETTIIREEEVKLYNYHAKIISDETLIINNFINYNNIASNVYFTYNDNKIINILLRLASGKDRVNLSSDFLYSFDKNNDTMTSELKILDFTFDSNLDKIIAAGKISFHKDADNIQAGSDLNIRFFPKASWYDFYYQNPQIIFGNNFISPFNDLDKYSNKLKYLIPNFNDKSKEIELNINLKLEKDNNITKSIINELSLGNSQFKISLENTRIYDSKKFYIIGELNLVGYKYIMNNLQKYLIKNTEILSAHQLPKGQKFDFSTFKDTSNKLIKKAINERHLLDEGFIIVVNSQDNEILLGDIKLNNFIKDAKKEFISK